MYAYACDICFGHICTYVRYGSRGKSPRNTAFLPDQETIDHRHMPVLCLEHVTYVNNEIL